MNERRETREEEKGQAVIEFTFCMIIVFLMIYAIIMVLRWTGRDLAARRAAHEGLLRTPAATEANGPNGPRMQINPYFYTPVGIKAVWGE
jgi:hypothetical protein